MSELHFALVGDREQCEDAQVLLGLIIKDFARKEKAIAKLYPSVGIGDTATDEAITSEIYKLIHG